MKLHWTDDPQAESQLAAVGVSWTRADILLSEVDLKLSLENNARLDKPLCEDTALEYACALGGGTKFPAPVFRLNGNAKYRVLSGNHRSSAVEMLVENHDLPADEAVFVGAYIVTTDDPMALDLICRAANRWQGRRQGKAEALEHVRYMVKKYSMTIEEACKQFFLPVPWVKSRLKAEENRAMLHSQNVPTSNLTDNQIVKLGQLGFNQKLMAKTACMAQEFKLKTEETKNLVDKVKLASQSSEQAGIQAIKDMELNYKATKLKISEGTASARRPLRARFFSHLNAFHNFLKCGNKGREFMGLDEMQVAGKHDRHAAREVWKQLKRKLDTLFHDADAADRRAS